MQLLSSLPSAGLPATPPSGASLNANGEASPAVASAECQPEFAQLFPGLVSAQLSPATVAPSLLLAMPATPESMMALAVQLQILPQTDAVPASLPDDEPSVGADSESAGDSDLVVPESLATANAWVAMAVAGLLPPPPPPLPMTVGNTAERADLASITVEGDQPLPRSASLANGQCAAPLVPGVSGRMDVTAMPLAAAVTDSASPALSRTADVASFPLPDKSPVPIETPSSPSAPLVAALTATFVRESAPGLTPTQPAVSQETERAAAAVLSEEFVAADQASTAQTPTKTRSVDRAQVEGASARASEAPVSSGGTVRPPSERVLAVPGSEREPVAPPTAQVANGRAANVAAVYSENLPRSVSDGKGVIRSFLSASHERVVSDEAALGTGVANAESVMPTSTFQRHPSDLGEHFASISTTTLPGEFSKAGATSPSAAAASVAYRAVNSVVEATERLATSGAGVVNLRFSVAGADLAVRVELRSGEVHVTFRSDSSELRTALAQEWQAASNSEAGRPLRAIEPVFAPAKSSGFEAASDGGASPQHRDSAARQFGDTHQSRPMTPRIPSFFPMFDPQSSSTRVVPLATALRLHTFA